MDLTVLLIINGIVSGFLATVFMTALMMIVTKLGLSELNLPVRIGRKILGEKISEPRAKMFGMIVHMKTGMGLGILYTLLLGVGALNFLGDNVFVMGMTFSILPWLIMMLGLLPQIGAGLFGKEIGMKVAPMTLVLHLVYGAVLGFLITVIPLA